MRSISAACILASLRRLLADGSTPITVNVLQWNPHWECFNAHSTPSGCGSQAKEALIKIAEDHSLDFANVVEIDEQSDYEAPKHYKKLTARCGNPVIDSTSLVFQRYRWQPLGDALEGCMADYADRAFLVQAFRSLNTSQVLIVVGAHYPHNNDNGKLRAAVQQAMGVNPGAGVLFLADTNAQRDVSTATILTSLAGSSGEAAPLYPTCCHNKDSGPYDNKYDRVALIGGSLLSSEMLFDPEPTWADILGPRQNQGKFHKAVFASFKFDGQRGAPRDLLV